MARAEEGDILAYVAWSGAPRGIPAECQTRLASEDDDPLIQDFVTGCFFEVTGVSLGLKLESGEGDLRSNGEEYSYDSWVNRTARQGTTITWAVKPDELTFERLIDRASPLLMQCCLCRTPLTSVVLVKRHSIGGQPRGYARFKLDTPTLKSIQWADGDAVKETCTFSFQALTVQFQAFDGSGMPNEAREGAWTSRATNGAGNTGD